MYKENWLAKWKREIAGDNNDIDPEEERYSKGTTNESAVFVAFEEGRTAGNDFDGDGDEDGNGERVVKLLKLVVVNVGITVGMLLPIGKVDGIRSNAGMREIEGNDDTDTLVLVGAITIGVARESRVASAPASASGDFLVLASSMQTA